MYIAYYWLDSWLKLMNACAEQLQSLETDAAATAAATAREEETAGLRRALAEHEQALAVALQQRHEMETQIACERHAAERERAEAQAEIERLRAALQRAETECATARQETGDLHKRLAALRSEAEREQAAHANKIAALTRTASEAEQSAKTERRERTAAEARAKQLKEDLAAAEAQVKRLRGEVTTAEAARLSAVQARARLEGELAQLRTKAERERKVLEDRVTELARQMAEAPRQPPPADRRMDRAVDAAAVPVRKPRKPRTAKTESADSVPATGREPVQPATAELVVHFRKPDHWAGSAYVHYWDSEPHTDAPAWPGLAMTPAADGWWVARIDGVRAASLVFHDNTGNQTADLYRDRPGRLDADGAWQDVES